MTSGKTTAKREPEERLVTLINKRKRMVPYNLAGEHMRDHKTFGYRRVSQSRTVHNPRTGVLGTKRGRASVPSSITFCAREKKENLPQALTRCPEVDAAIKRGDLKCIYQDDGWIVHKAKGEPRKTTFQVQKEREEATKKAEADHKKTSLYKDTIAAHEGTPTKRKPPIKTTAHSSSSS